MTCVKGRANPNLQTKLRLFSDAAGYCQRPNCRRRLFSGTNEEDYHIAEMAHVFAAADVGPRANSNLTKQERAQYCNLILLCPNCHTEIDKAPGTFSDSLIRKWKEDHKTTIEQVLGAAKFQTRCGVRKFIEPIMAKNKTIFDEYGPNNSYRENPEAEEAQVWQRKMRTQIIPNNQEILLALDANIVMAKENEKTIIEVFRQHIDDLIEVHIVGEMHQAIRFPKQMSLVFLDNEDSL